MKIFKKSHQWKENKTFLELEATEPEKERGFAKEGHILLKIGQQSNVKSAFKLSVDEARAMRDTIDMFLRFHDMKFSEFMTDQQEQFQKFPDYYQREPDGIREDYMHEEEVEEKPQQHTEPLFLFGQSEEKDDDEIERKKQEKINSEYYF